MHRDWETLLRAVEGNNNVELRIATDPSSRWNHSLKRLAYNPNQITIEPLRSLERIHDAYEWADIVVVPLTPNRHNSGITVILEAVTAGKPVIAANAGGLKGYFGDDEIRYVPPGNVEALAVAVEECTRKVDDTLARVKNAQAKLLAAGLTTKARVSSHISLTEELLS